MISGAENRKLNSSA